MLISTKDRTFSRSPYLVQYRLSTQSPKCVACSAGMLPLRSERLSFSKRPSVAVRTCVEFMEMRVYLHRVALMRKRGKRASVSFKM